ncbi:AcrVA2 family anti-CRISPR protein [Cupriavidus sp. 2MCAB6]|uniref:AcrVA2 family anti-CRISPR protein n=1 Tax=Cupriavidus sp. 2MCAB6 TaxID=3232981 RepID=UPI003F932838
MTNSINAAHAPQPQVPAALPSASGDAAKMQPGYWLTHVGTCYPGLLATTDKLRALRDPAARGWPDHYYIPYTLLRNMMMRRLGLRPGDPTPKGLVTHLQLVATIAAWRVTQGIYRIDPTVYDALCATPVTGELPAALLRHLPEWCVYLETPGMHWDDLLVYGVFANLCETNTGREVLMLQLNYTDGLLTCPIDLTRRTLGEAIRGMFQSMREDGMAPEPDFERNMPTLLPRILSLLLYLCSEAAEIGDGASRPSRPVPKRTKKGVRMFAAQRPVCWDVATRLGAALRRAGRDAAGDAAGAGDGAGTHAGPRPHIRRAHWHTYLSGPRDSAKRTLRWMPPIPVNVETPDDLVPTLRSAGTADKAGAGKGD